MDLCILWSVFINCFCHIWAVTQSPYLAPTLWFSSILVLWLPLPRFYLQDHGAHHRSLPCTAVWTLSRDAPRILSLFDPLSGLLPWAAWPLWATNRPALHFSGSRREKRTNQSLSSSSARSRSVIFLDTKVFPKLGCVLSSEKLIKNKDSWASTQNSWCWRGCLGTRICNQSLKWYWLQPAVGWPVRDLLAYRQRVFVSKLWLSE